VVQSQHAFKTTEGLVAAGEAAFYEGLPAGTPDCTLHVTCMSVAQQMAVMGSMLQHMIDIHVAALQMLQV